MAHATEQKPTTTNKKPTIAYVPFKSFLAAIQAFEQILPDTIDRTVFHSMSGAIYSQLLAAFRFLGLMNADGTPTLELEKLVKDKANRKANLRKILERSYPEIMKRGLMKMSAGSFDSAMKVYGLQGDTHRKGTSFFLQAARYAELPLSSLILAQTRKPSGPRKRRVPEGADRQNGASGKGTSDGASHVTGPTKTISLRNGISLSLMASADMFKMDAPDREFVLKLLEEMEAHENTIKGV
jgi:hypothetical protein